MFCACGPLGPCATSKLTFWFSLSVLKPLPWIAEKCAKRSLPPSSGVMKPKPLESLNHLTVPVAIFHFLFIHDRVQSRHARVTITKEGNCHFGSPGKAGEDGNFTAWMILHSHY